MAGLENIFFAFKSRHSSTWCSNIFTFTRRFYPKRLTVHSGYNFFCQYICSLGIEPTTFALPTQCSTTEPQEHINKLKIHAFILRVYLSLFGTNCHSTVLEIEMPGFKNIFTHLRVDSYNSNQIYIRLQKQTYTQKKCSDNVVFFLFFFFSFFLFFF